MRILRKAIMLSLAFGLVVNPALAQAIAQNAELGKPGIFFFERRILNSELIFRSQTLAPDGQFERPMLQPFWAWWAWSRQSFARAAGGELSLFRNDFYRTRLAGLESFIFGALAIGLPLIGLVHAAGLTGQPMNLTRAVVMLASWFAGGILYEDIFVWLHKMIWKEFCGLDLSAAEMHLQREAVRELKAIFYSALIPLSGLALLGGWSLWWGFVLASIILSAAHYANDWLSQAKDPVHRRIPSRFESRLIRAFSWTSLGQTELSLVAGREISGHLIVGPDSSMGMEKIETAQRVLEAAGAVYKAYPNEILDRLPNAAMREKLSARDYDGFRYVSHGKSYVVFESRDWPHLIFKTLKISWPFTVFRRAVDLGVLIRSSRFSGIMDRDGWLMSRISKLAPFTYIDGVIVEPRMPLSKPLAHEQARSFTAGLRQDGIVFDDAFDRNLGDLDTQNVLLDLEVGVARLALEKAVAGLEVPAALLLTESEIRRELDLMQVHITAPAVSSFDIPVAVLRHAVLHDRKSPLDALEDVLRTIAYLERNPSVTKYPLRTPQGAA